MQQALPAEGVEMSNRIGRARAALLVAALAPIALAASGVGAQTGEAGTPTVMLHTVSDLDDMAKIRPARLLAMETWLKAEDFPPETFEAGKMRGLNLKLMVDAKGATTGCANYGPETDLSTRACARIIERGRFIHAIDAAGTPQPSERVMSVTFLIVTPGMYTGLSPAPPPMGYRNTKPILRNTAVLQLAPDAQKFIEPAPDVLVDVSATGRVTRCRIRTSAGTDAGDADICRRITKAKFDPARDPQGKKVPAQNAYFTFKVAAQ